MLADTTHLLLPTEAEHSVEVEVDLEQNRHNSQGLLRLEVEAEGLQLIRRER
jgi:hypothetical protein